MSASGNVGAVYNSPKKLRFLEFWEKKAADYYDVYVLGDKSSSEISEFISDEDNRLDKILESMVEKNEEFIFIEIGSGTGRYISSLADRIIRDPNYDRLLKYIIGLDCSWNMIQTCIDNLLSREPRLIRISREADTIKIYSLWSKLEFSQNALNKIIDRIVLINCDASKPILRISEGVKVVVAIMFGTLGNIRYRRNELIKYFKKISTDVILVASVFRRDKNFIGYRRYSELADNGFATLRKITWDGSSFVSKDGFYSHWFDEHEFKQILDSGKTFCKIEVQPLLDRGFMGFVRTKEIGTSIFRRKAHFDMGLSCPRCGRVIKPLPLRRISKIQHIEHNMDQCNCTYSVREYRGFFVPIML